MKEVRVRTVRLKERIQANREEHSKQHKLAVDGWANEVSFLMLKDLEALRSGERRKLAILDPLPEDHTPDYDRVLAMLDMSEDEFQTLEMDVFRQYVLDDWSWKQRWSVSTAKYLSGQ